MSGLFGLAGVDRVQWRALVRAYVWIDHAALLGAHGPVEARRSALRLFGIASFLSVLGLGLAFVVWLAADLFSAALVVLTTIMFWAGLIAVSQSTALASPDDHDLVGFRPVTSTTLLAVRVTALLWPCLETALLMGWLPVLAFLTRSDGSLLAAAAAAAAIGGSVIFVVLSIALIHAWLIQIVPPARLTRWLAYAGAALSVGLAAGSIIGTQLLQTDENPAALLSFVAPRDVRTMWFPGAWFATYVTIADGSTAAADLGFAVLSLGAIVSVGLAFLSRVGRQYSERIAEFVGASVPAGTADRLRLRALRGERRAAAILVLHHLQDDMRFQVAVVMSVVMGLLLTLMASGFRSLPRDPFQDGSTVFTGIGPLFAVFFVPSHIYQSLITSTSAGASWFFHSTASSKGAVVAGARDAVAILVLCPAFLLLVLLYWYSFGHVVHALLNASVIALFGLTALHAITVLGPRLPFSVALVGTRNAGPPLFTQMAVMLIGGPVFLAFDYVAYRTIWHAIAGIATLVLLNVALDRMLRRRIARNGSLLAYPA